MGLTGNVGIGSVVVDLDHRTSRGILILIGIVIQPTEGRRLKFPMEIQPCKFDKKKPPISRRSVGKGLRSVRPRTFVLCMTTS